MSKPSHYTGLTAQEVLQSRQAHGHNVLTPPEKESLWRQYLHKFSDPLILILCIAGALSIGIACYEYLSMPEEVGLKVFFEPVGILLAILLATGLAFIFEYQADKEFAILNQVNDDEAVQVIRDGRAQQIAKRDVVVGDILLVGTGEEIAADAEVLSAVTLHVDESTLNGESVPALKSPLPEDQDPTASYPTNQVLRGTKVMEGHGICRVQAVGDKTENGKVYKAAQIDNSVKTPLNEQLDGLGRLITHLGYAFAALIIIAKLLVFFHWHPLALLIVVPTAVFFYMVVFRFARMNKKRIALVIALFFVAFIASVLGVDEVLHPGQDVTHLLAYTLQTLMIAVTLIVVSVPEGLPMAVTLSLAYSMRRMLKTQNLVRKMHACETMGATTVICTDKTGTLTQNQMNVHEACFYAPASLRPYLLEGMAVNATAQLEHSPEQPTRVLGNPTEGALLLWLEAQGEDYVQLRESVQRLEEIPFSTERKYMATLVQRPSGERVLYVKGAPEMVLRLCQRIEGEVSQADIDSQLQQFQQQAMRTLGFAYHILQDGEVGIRDGQLVETSLSFLGIVAISDPVRADVPAAVQECMQAGIAIKMVTGDTPGTAREIARQIGLWQEGDGERNLITGPEFAALSDEALRERVMDLKIIARARPLDKKRLVETLQSLNQVVAVTGDGTNDAPALKAAHVGLSMGDGTSVAKEASDITIIDNSFSSIGRAVMWGRSLYQNIQRFLLFQLTVNVAACLTVLCGSFLGEESPLTVTQMLWVNLIMDTFGAMALSSLPPSERVMQDKPRHRGEVGQSLTTSIRNGSFILTRSMVHNILGVGGFFFAILMVFLLLFRYEDIHAMTDFLHYQPTSTHEVTPYELTLLFSIFVWTHFWYMFNARGYLSGRTALQLKGCKGFWMVVGVIVLGQVFIVEVADEFFNITPMRFDDWIIIVVGSSLVLWVREAFQWLRRHV